MFHDVDLFVIVLTASFHYAFAPVWFETDADILKAFRQNELEPLAEGRSFAESLGIIFRLVKVNIRQHGILRVVPLAVLLICPLRLTRHCSCFGIFFLG